MYPGFALNGGALILLRFQAQGTKSHSLVLYGIRICGFHARKEFDINQ